MYSENLEELISLVLSEKGRRRCGRSDDGH